MTNYHKPLRGSSWRTRLDHLHSARRAIRDGRSYASDTFGLRVVIYSRPLSLQTLSLLSAMVSPTSTSTLEALQALGLVLVDIPAGSFLMGSADGDPLAYDDEKPQHQVSVRAFRMSDTPVTQAQWKWVAENLPKVKIDLPASPSYFKGDDRPVESVSWYQCQEFCDRMSVALGYSLDNPREQRVALPSEAEWEYACRAGTTTHYNTGNTLTEDQANFNGNVGETTPVRKYAPNAWGLYDMHGNVWEWCADKWHDSYEGAPTDGSAWED